MRSDYYDQLPQTPLRPLPRRKRRRRGLWLFGATLTLLLAGTLAAAAMARQLPAPSASPTAAEPQRGATTIQTRTPPGEGTLSLTASAEGQSLDPTEIYRRVSPSILTVTAMDAQGGGGEGTGVLFDPAGYFVTNSHVIEGAQSVWATLADGRRYPAWLIGMDRQSDLAVLCIPASDLTAAPFWEDTALKVGESVYALGNPLGSQFSGSMTDGILSAINRNVVVEEYEMSLLQTTAALNPGNSGGALVDSRGLVVGITNLKMMSMNSTVEGLGFAIPSSTVAQVVNELMTHGHVTGRPMLGVTVRPASEIEHAGGGLYVEGVEEASDAWAKGVRPGDILLAANGVPLTQNADLLAEKEGLAAGEGLRLRWLEGTSDQEREAEILLVEQYQLEQ